MAKFNMRINLKWRERFRLLWSGSIILNINAAKREIRSFEGHVMSRKERKIADKALLAHRKKA